MKLKINLFENVEDNLVCNKNMVIEDYERILWSKNESKQRSELNEVKLVDVQSQIQV